MTSIHSLSAIHSPPWHCAMCSGGNSPLAMTSTSSAGSLVFTSSSPFSTVVEKGLLEVKTKLPALLVDVIASGEFPPEHIAQCQGGLWIAEREWIDVIVYWRGLPLFVKRAERMASYIETLAKEVAAFNAELADLVASIRAYSAPALDMAA